MTVNMMAGKNPNRFCFLFSGEQSLDDCLGGQHRSSAVHRPHQVNRRISWASSFIGRTDQDVEPSGNIT